MSDEDQRPAVSLVGVPRADGEDWRGHAFIPEGNGLSLRGSVGVTLLFHFVNHPRVADPEVQERYKSHSHDFQDTELVVNGETYPAVEVQDAELAIRVRVANFDGQTVVATLPADQDVPEVTVTWPQGNES